MEQHCGKTGVSCTLPQQPVAYRWKYVPHKVNSSWEKCWLPTIYDLCTVMIQSRLSVRFSRLNHAVDTKSVLLTIIWQCSRTQINLCSGRLCWLLTISLVCLSVNLMYNLNSLFYLSRLCICNSNVSRVLEVEYTNTVLS